MSIHMYKKVPKEMTEFFLLLSSRNRADRQKLFRDIAEKILIDKPEVAVKVFEDDVQDSQIEEIAQKECIVWFEPQMGRFIRLARKCNIGQQKR